MAETLIDRFTSTFKHEKYRDEYTDRLLDIVKRKGEEIHAPPPEEREEQPDLLEALRASVDAAKSKSISRSGSKARSGRTKRKPSGRRQSRARSR
jgi:DNA end-binding protein Ku